MPPDVAVHSHKISTQSIPVQEPQHLTWWLPRFMSADQLLFGSTFARPLLGNRSGRRCRRILRQDSHQIFSTQSWGLNVLPRFCLVTWSAGAKPRCNSEHFWHLDNLSLQSLISADSCFEKFADRPIAASCEKDDQVQTVPGFARFVYLWKQPSMKSRSCCSVEYGSVIQYPDCAWKSSFQTLRAFTCWNLRFQEHIHLRTSLRTYLEPGIAIFCWVPFWKPESHFCYVVGSACTSIVRKNCELPSFDAMEDYCGDLVEVRILRQLIFFFFFATPVGEQSVF